MTIAATSVIHAGTPNGSLTRVTPKEAPVNRVYQLAIGNTA
jgi:hypothetical protein